MDPTATHDDDAQDPTEDTLADESQDTAPDTQGSTVDWESRYKELQKRATRAERERDLLRQQTSAESDEDEEEDEEEVEAPSARTQTTNDRLARDSWTLAEQIYGESALDAYGQAAKLLNRAVTPADHIAAFETYFERRLAGATPEQAKAQAKGDPAPQRRIESNRPDASPDLTDIDRKAEAAKGRGDLRGFLAAQLERAGVR